MVGTLIGRLRMMHLRIAFNVQARSAFYERMAVAVRHGQAPLVALDTMLSAYATHDPDSSVQRTLGEIRARCVHQGAGSTAGGERIDAALAGLIPQGEYLLLHAAAQRSELAQGFEAVRELSEAMAQLNSVLMSKSIKPLVQWGIVFLLLIAGHIALGNFVEHIPIASWPLLSRAFYETSGLIVDHLFWVALLLPVLLTGVWTLTVRVPRHPRVRQWYHRSRPLLERFQPFATYRLFNGFVFLTALSGLLRGGDAPLVALKALREDSNPYLRTHLDCMITAIAHHNQPPGEAIAGTGLLAKEEAMTIVLLSTGGDFVRAVADTGSAALGHAEQRLNRALWAFTFISTMAAYAVVVLFALAQISLSMSMASF